MQKGGTFGVPLGAVILSRNSKLYSTTSMSTSKMHPPLYLDIRSAKPHLQIYFGLLNPLSKSPFLIIRSSPFDILQYYHCASTQHRRLRPATSYHLSSLQSIISLNTANNIILIRIFSDGGCHQFCTFLCFYPLTAPALSPPYIEVPNSCPSCATFHQSFRAF